MIELTLLICPLQHATDFQNIGLCAIGTESIPRSIEAQNDLDRLRPRCVIHCRQNRRYIEVVRPQDAA